MACAPGACVSPSRDRGRMNRHRLVLLIVAAAVVMAAVAASAAHRTAHAKAQGSPGFALAVGHTSESSNPTDGLIPRGHHPAMSPLAASGVLVQGAIGSTVPAVLSPPLRSLPKMKGVLARK